MMIEAVILHVTQIITGVERSTHLHPCTLPSSKKSQPSLVGHYYGTGGFGSIVVMVNYWVVRLWWKPHGLRKTGFCALKK